jgi:two-component system OmpR family sensor kinase
MAVLVVRDNGPGIAADQQAQLFERFFRADTASSATERSTGLGLAIVAAVVHAHQGSVTVSSHPGDTRFTVVLPLAASPGPDSALGEDREVDGGLGAGEPVLH